jgi:hypothetical protein
MASKSTKMPQNPLKKMAQNPSKTPTFPSKCVIAAKTRRASVRFRKLVPVAPVSYQKMMILYEKMIKTYEKYEKNDEKCLKND